jgi:hypothetical protein
MRRVVPAVQVLLSAIVLAAQASGPGTTARASSREPEPYRVLAGPYSKKDVTIGTGSPVARANVGELAIAVEFLDPAARVAFVRSIASTMPDPFAPRPGRPEAFSVFRVSFTNRSGVDVQFQPQNVVLLTDRKTQEFPVDLTDLYRSAELAGAADPERVFERLTPIVFDSATTIAKGTSLERLLVFGPFPVKWKQIQLHFSFLQIGTETRTVSFQFHKQPGKG